MLWPDDITDDELLAASADVVAEKPLEKWRSAGYLWVSHLVSQSWCEQQMVYGLASKVDVIGEPEHVRRGHELHLARELETEDYVDVAVDSDEDIFAVKAINLLQHLNRLTAVSTTKLAGGGGRGQVTKCREVPIFGWAGEIFLMGKVDEIRGLGDCSTKRRSVELVEFKTRTKKCLPSRGQTDGHRLQVLIYKRLFDKLKTLDAGAVCSALSLDAGRQVNADLRRLVRPLATVGDILSAIRAAAIKHDFNISDLIVEYAVQGERSVAEVFASTKVASDDDWLTQKLGKYEDYWLGRRPSQGVDIEEAWKCAMCSFADECSWRTAKISELQLRVMQKEK